MPIGKHAYVLILGFVQVSKLCIELLLPRKIEERAILTYLLYMM